MPDRSLKQLTAKSIKWNIIDKVSSQLLYAVTGVVLARQLSQEAFGLVGAVTIFQAFATLFVDGGFHFALMQRKRPTELDYSSVFWFNMIVATAIYVILWLCAPFIASLFDNDQRLIPLSRVMFLTFIINAAAIVQTNRLMKQMNFRPLAIINSISLIAAAVVGIYMAYAGYGAWAIVWQAITLNGVKTICLWLSSRWTPMFRISFAALRSFFGVGVGMMLTSFLNVLFQNIYSFFIGHRVGLVPLGYYTQADKWSKMGVSSISQVLNTSFLPALAEVQDDPPRFRNMVSKMNRFTGYLLFPCMLFLMAMAEPIFHTLFGTKWDAAIILFQLLLARGIFTVLNSLYTQYILALGKSGTILWLEAFRDGIALVGIVVTLPFIALETPDNIVYGLVIFLSGQLIASFVTWVATIIMTARITSMPVIGYLRDLAPYVALGAAVAVVIYAINWLSWPPIMLLTVQLILGFGLYMALNAILASKIQSEVLAHLLSKFRKAPAPESQP